MTSLVRRHALLASLVFGFALLAGTTAFDLLAHEAPTLPAVSLAFLLFLVIWGPVMAYRIGLAQRESNNLRRDLSQSTTDRDDTAEAYGRFVPVQFLKHLKRDTITDIHLGDQVERTMTVMFSDIRNFTALSEKLSPQDSFRFLNDYLGRIGPVIRENYGFIDKYIGDAIMALFDGPVDEALSAAMAIQLATAEYNRHLRDGQPGPLTVGIGMHSGPLMLGIIGEESRMESTVIADAVNLASRIESLTKHYDCRILVSRSTFEAQMDPIPCLTRPVDLVRVKGKSNSVELLEILDERFVPRAALKIDLSARLAEAMMVYRRGDLGAARTLFQSLAYRDPEDTLYGIYRRRIEDLLRLGLPAGWDGTTVFDVK